MAFLFGSHTNVSNSNGSQLADLMVSSSANGAFINIAYGTNSMAANIIWSPGLVEHSTTVTQSGGKGGSTTTSTQYSYTASFAAAFCEGPGTIIKIWGDTQVLYDNSGPFSNYQGVFNSGTLYQVGQVVKAGPNFYVCTHQATSLPFPSPTSVLGSFFWSPYTGSPVVVAGGQQYPSPTFYHGTDTQMPDPTIQAQLGVSGTSAFRNLVYCVWDNLQVNNFGNRIPSIRGVVVSGLPSASPPVLTGGVDYIVEDICERSGIDPTEMDTTDLAAISTTAADIYQSDGSGIPALTLLTGGVVTFYQGSGCGAPFGFTYPGFDGNVPLPAARFSYAMKPNQTLIFNPYPAASLSGYTSFLPGWTPTTSYNLLPMSIVGVVSGGAGPATWDGTAVAPFVPGNVGGFVQANWDMVVSAKIQIAVPGQYTFYCSCKDGILIGIGGGATRVSGPMTNNSARHQTKSALKGYPIVFANNINNPDHSTNVTLSTFVVNFPAAGTYGIEMDYASHDDARTLCLNWKMGSVQSPLLPVSGTDGADPITEAFGFMITGQKDSRSVIKDLQDAFFFDPAESDFKLKFVRRGVHASVMTIAEDDLGLMADSSKLTEMLTQEQDAPQTVTVGYIDPSIDYQQGSQQKRRSSRVVNTKNQVNFDLPIAMSQTLARGIAEKQLYSSWMERNPYDINLWKAFYALLDPTDVVDFVYENTVFQERLETSAIGQDFSLKLSGVSQLALAYATVVPGGSAAGFVATVLTDGGDTIAYLFDIPYLQDTDASLDRLQTGIYWVLVGSDPDWAGAVLLQSPTGSVYNQLGTEGLKASFGYATDTLPDAPIFYTWDTTSTLNINMVRGSLAGVTDDDVLNGANAMLVGNELIQFVNAVQEIDGSYTISRLLRGRRNTEPFSVAHAGLAGSPPIGEACILLGNVIQRSTFPDNFVGRTEQYKGVTTGHDPSGVSPEAFTSAGNDLKPAAPAHITGTRDISNNLTVNFYRRTRYGGQGLVGPTPLCEDSEQYSMDVLSGLTVKRTIAWTPGTYDGLGNPNIVYTAAQQTTDGFTPGNPVSVVIYQVSAQVGRGFPSPATI